MRELNRAAQSVVAVSTVLAVLALAAFPPWSATGWSGAAVVVSTACTVVVWLWAHRLPTGVVLAPGEIGPLALLLVYGPMPAAIAAVAGVMGNSIVVPRPPHRAMFNSGAAVIGIWVAWRIITAGSGLTWPPRLLLGLAAALTWTVFHYLAVCLIRSVARRCSYASVARYGTEYLPMHILWSTLSVVAAIIWELGPAAGLASLVAFSFLVGVSTRSQAALTGAMAREPGTGVMSAQHLHQRLRELAAEARRDDEPLTVAMVDLTGLRGYKDQHGLAARDALLAHLGRLLANLVDWPAFVARLDSSRFVMVLPGLREPAAQVLLDQVWPRLISARGVPRPVGLHTAMATRQGRQVVDGEILAAAERQLEEIASPEQSEADERLRRAERFSALGNMSAAIAHEIRNPLTTVQGFLQLQRERLDPEAYALIRSELDRVLTLVQDFLRLSKPSPVVVRPLDLLPVLAAAARLGGALAAQRGGKLATSWPPSLPPVLGDDEQIRQVLLNLLANAFDAAAAGEVGLRAALDGSWVVISVCDNGSGVPAELSDRIFDPFVSTKPGGTGLGLAVSHRIMNDLGGWLELAETGPGGSCFRFGLRAAHPDQPDGPGRRTH